MSAPMISWRPAVDRIYRWLTTSNPAGSYIITLPSVPIHDIETQAEKRPRTLKHLLKANHSNYAIYFNSLRFHNHLPHHLGSAYLLGASTEQLHTIYVDEGKTLDPWDDPPSNITEHDWRSYLGKKEYQRAYVDFFEDELALNHDYKWRDVVAVFMFDGKQPLINAVTGELGHPLIHLAYAYELDSREVAMEAVAMTASSYSSLHKYFDDPSYTRPSPIQSASTLELLHKIHDDSRLDGAYENHAGNSCASVVDSHEAIVLEYWNAWTLEDPLKDFASSQEAAAALLVATVPPKQRNYDFFLVHLLTTSHAIRVLLPLIPTRHHLSLVRQWWLLTVMTYIGQLRPQINEEWISDPARDTGKDRNWAFVEDKAINGVWATDAHFVKAVRALKSAAETWGDGNKRYLDAALKLVNEFDGWTGFEVGHKGSGH